MRQRRDAGTGVFATAFGFTAFLVFLLFTVQVLFGLYARTTVAAVASDVAHRAAVDPEVTDAHVRDRFGIEASDRLGRYGDDAVVAVDLTDADGDGSPDTVTVTIDADLPVLLPTTWVGYSPTRFRRAASARLETFQEPVR